MRLEFLEQDIRWNLEEDIWNKKDSESDIGLVAFKMQVLRHMKRKGIADVDAIQNGRQVEKE